MSESRNLVMVIGAGRSGTSLAMQALEYIGCSISEETQIVGHQNPQGAFEDAQIFQEIKVFFNANSTNHFFGLPDDYLASNAADKALNRLTKIIVEHVEGSKGLWAFKEPKSALIMDLWIQVFNRAKVIPKFILAVRDPKAVVDSFSRNYGTTEEEAEYLWLNKYTEALNSTKCGVYIFHYESFLNSQKSETIALAKYIGMADTLASRTKPTKLVNIVQDSSNRSSFNDIKIKNKSVKRLYKALKGCSGAQFDREHLFDEVTKSMKHKKNFSGLISAGHRIIQTQKKAIRKNQNLAKEQNQLASTNLQASFESKLLVINDSLVKASKVREQDLVTYTKEMQLIKDELIKIGESERLANVKNEATINSNLSTYQSHIESIVSSMNDKLVNLNEVQKDNQALYNEKILMIKNEVTKIREKEHLASLENAVAIKADFSKFQTQVEGKLALMSDELINMTEERDVDQVLYEEKVLLLEDELAKMEEGCLVERQGLEQKMAGFVKQLDEERIRSSELTENLEQVTLQNIEKFENITSSLLILERDLSSATDQVTILESQNIALIRQFNEARSTRNQVERRFRKLNVQTNQLVSQNDVLRGKNGDLRTNNNLLRPKNEKLRSKNDDLRFEIANLTAFKNSRVRQQTAIIIENSYTYRLGSLLVKFYQRPWLILTVGAGLFILLLDIIFVRGKLKAESLAFTSTPNTEVNWLRKIEKLLSSKEWRVGRIFTRAKSIPLKSL